VCILGVCSLLLHGPSHIGSMTDLISHFATVEGECCGWDVPLDSGTGRTASYSQ
jgi:hypothetical protein